MFHLDSSDSLDDVLLYQNKIYLVEKNQITSEKIEQVLSYLKYNNKSKVIDSKIEYSNIPSVSKIFYIMIFNLKKILDVEEFTNMYINAYFFENKDYTYSQKDFSIRFPQKYSYIGLKSRVYNDYAILIKHYHLYLMLYESKKFTKVIYSLKNEIYKGLNLKINYEDKSYRLLVNNNGNINLDMKNNNGEYVNIYNLNIYDSKLENQIQNFNLFDYKIVDIIERKILENTYAKKYL